MFISFRRLIETQSLRRKVVAAILGISVLLHPAADCRGDFQLST